MATRNVSFCHQEVSFRANSGSECSVALLAKSGTGRKIERPQTSARCGVLFFQKSQASLFIISSYVVAYMYR